MFKPEGKFAWYELITTDVEASGKFYSHVVGWTTQDVGNASQPYTTFNLGSTGIAGMLDVPGPRGWLGYISVAAVDEHIEHIVAAGGKLLRPAQDVPGMLRFAVVADPQGVAFVVFTPNPAMPSPERPQPPTPGTIGWHELYTSSVEAAFTFYQDLFGWSLLRDLDMGAHGIYRIFDQGDRPDMGDGGIMTTSPQSPVPAWTFYFNVESVNAAIERVKGAGGTVLHGPQQVPGGGWIALAKDPQGTHFSLVAASL